jgi:hypothetical protein
LQDKLKWAFIEGVDEVIKERTLILIIEEDEGEEEEEGVDQDLYTTHLLLQLYIFHY